MKFLNLTLSTVAEDLALDEALLLAAEAGQGGEVVRFWQAAQPAVVLGISGKTTEEVFVEHCQKDGVPILRRGSGGAAVVLGPGCLCYSLVLSYDRAADLEQIGCSYCFILGRLADALADLAPGLAPVGTSDLAVAGRKVSGNSQQRKRRFLLHHGTLLYTTQASRAASAVLNMTRYLKQPPRQPAYRANREHDAFVGSLNVAAEVIRQRLRAAWQANEPLSSWPEATVRQLVNEKYGRQEWHLRR